MSGIGLVLRWSGGFKRRQGEGFPLALSGRNR